MVNTPANGADSFAALTFQNQHGFEFDESFKNLGRVDEDGDVLGCCLINSFLSTLVYFTLMPKRRNPPLKSEKILLRT